MRTAQKTSRALPFARRVLRILDFLTFFILLSLAMLIPLWKSSPFGLCAVLFGAAAILLTVAERKEREQRMKETARAIRLEKILLMQNAQIKTALQVGSLAVLRQKEPSVAELMDALRTRPETLVTLADAEKLRPIVAFHAPETRLIDAEEICSIIPVEVSETEVHKRLTDMQKPETKKRRFSVHAAGRSWKFLLLGILLLVLSLILNHKIYYRLLCGACFSAATLSGVFDMQKRRMNFRIFLDNGDN